MTIANVPGPVLSIAGFDALTDAVATCCLCPQLVHVGLHCPLTGGVIGSGVVDEESAVVLFDHGSSIRGRMGRMGQIASTLSGVTFIHLIGAPLVSRQIVAGSSMARAIR